MSMIALDRRRAMPSTLVDMLKRMGCIMWFPLDEENGLNDVIGGKVIRNIASPGVAWYASYNLYYYAHAAANTAVADIDVDWTADTFPNGWTTFTQTRRYPNSSYRGTANGFCMSYASTGVLLHGFDETLTAVTSNWLDDNWHSAVVVASTSGRRLFVDKTFTLGDSSVYTAPYPITKIYVAPYTSTYANKRCCLKNVMMFNRQLTDNEVRWLCDKLDGKTPPKDVEILDRCYNNASAVVVTDYHTTRNTRVCVRCMMTELPTSSYNKQIVACTETIDGVLHRYDMQYTSAKKIGFCSYYNPTYAINTLYTINGWLDSTKVYMKLGTAANVSSNNSTIQTMNNTLGIFGASVEINAAAIFKGWFHGLEVFESGALVRYYLPAKKNGVVGLWEDMSGTFIAPAVGTLSETA